MIGDGDGDADDGCIKIPTCLTAQFLDSKTYTC